MWESVKDVNGRFTDRLKVPGGWLVRCSMNGTMSSSICVIFFEDANHSWVLS